MTLGSYGQGSSSHQSPDARALVLMVLTSSSTLTHSSRTFFFEPGDDIWEFCQNFPTEAAGLCLCFLSDYVHGWRVNLLCN